MSEWLFAIQALIKDDAYAPNIDLGRNFRGILADDKALWRQIPEAKDINVGIIRVSN